MGLFGGGNSKSETINNQTEANDTSTKNGLAVVTGNSNTTSVLDGGAIRDAYTYAAQVNDNNSNNFAALLNTVDSVTGRTITAAAENSNKTLQSLQSGLTSAAGAIQTAYTKQQNGGIDPQVILIGVGVLVLAFIFKG